MFEYGVIIGEKHTARDWGLVCTQVEIGKPEQKKYYVEVPGKDGYLDLSEVLTGEPHYGNRELKVSLIRRESDFRRWHVKASDIYDYCHNMRRKVVFDSDPGYYYEGRLGRRMKVVPVFECSAEMVLSYGGAEYNLPAGRSKIPDLRIGEGEHYLMFAGSGTVSVDYRGGRL